MSFNDRGNSSCDPVVAGDRAEPDLPQRRLPPAGSPVPTSSGLPVMPTQERRRPAGCRASQAVPSLRPGAGSGRRWTLVPGGAFRSRTDQAACEQLTSHLRPATWRLGWGSGEGEGGGSFLSPRESWTPPRAAGPTPGPPRRGVLLSHGPRFEGEAPGRLAPCFSGACGFAVPSLPTAPKNLRHPSRPGLTLIELSSARQPAL